MSRPQHVDSVVPREIALERFQAGLTRPNGLTGGAPSRDALVRAFMEALASRDTAAFRAMALTRPEFAFLYYPTSPQSLPPYDLTPELMWFLLEGASRKGLARALQERGGKRAEYAGHECASEPSVQGENRVWEPCLVRLVGPEGKTTVLRLFGPVVERDGRFKLVSFANGL